MTTEKELQSIISDFLTFFSSKGYIVHKSEPLIPRTDKTLAFTNATIVPLKKYLDKEFHSPGYVIAQPCIRLRNIANNNFNGHFTSFFRMVSILVTSSVSFLDLTDLIEEYLEFLLKLQTKKVVIHYDSRTEDLMKGFKKKYVLKKGIKPRSFYSWKYGMKSIQGRGITFCVNTKYGLQELGNLVEISSPEKILGYEFGFGVESALTILHELEDNYEVLFGKKGNKKILDLTCVMGVIYQNLSEPITGTTRSSIRKILSELAYSIVESSNANCLFIKEMNWKLFDVEQGTIQRLIKTLESKIHDIQESQKKLIAYRSYVAKMKQQGRNEEWAKKKLTTYIERNNLKRITSLTKVI